MTSSQNSETVVLIHADATIDKHKRKEKHKLKYKPRDTFGRISNPIELFAVYAFVIWVFFKCFHKMKLLSDEILSQSTRHTLKQGWISERKIDLSDSQWRSYRENFMIYLLFAISFIIVFKLLKYALSSYHKQPKQLALMYNLFHIIIGSIFIFYLHGIPCIVMLFFMLINYGIVKLSYKTKHCIIITWIYNVLIAFIAFHFEKELSPQYTISDFFPSLFFMDPFFKTTIHWNQSYRFGILRCISFNMDLYYFSTKQPIYKSPYDDTHTEFATNINDFCLIHYFAYLLYVPLQLMGPIIGFREWLIQIKWKLARNNHQHPHKHELSFRNCMLYLFRWFCLYILHELMLHYYYMHYISRFGYPKATELAERSDYLIVLALVSYVHLKLIWLKFNVIWKFARLWALLDEVVTVENMQRCISNTTSIVEFWKYWHSSFNVWNIRYLYIPLGGNKKNRILNTLLVFMFVFLWHGDFEISLLFWSVLMCVGMIPEIVAKRVCMKYNKVKNNRYILAGGSAVNVIVLIIANNIGFGGGLDRMLHVLNEFFVRNPWNGVPVFLFCYFCLCMVVIVMYHTRYIKQSFNKKQYLGEDK